MFRVRIEHCGLELRVRLRVDGPRVSADARS